MTRHPTSFVLAALLVLQVSTPSAAFQTRALFLSRFERTNDDTRLTAAQEMDSAAAVLDDFFRTQPFLSAFVACSVKASAADLLAQTSAVANASSEDVKQLVTKSTEQVNDAMQLLETVNIQRNFAFLLYGGLYQGMFLQFLYMVAYPALYGGSEFRIPLSIGSDICAFGPFVTLPIAYIIRAAIESRTSSESSSGGETHSSFTEPVQEAIEKYKNHVFTQNLLVKYWMIWAPAQTINWYFVPEHLRVFFVAFVSFFWVYLLSAISSQQTKTIVIEQEHSQIIRRMPNTRGHVWPGTQSS